MRRKKSYNILSVFYIFFTSIKTYFLYLDKLVKYMFIPVIGQVLGLFLIFLATYYYNNNVNNIRKIPFFAQNEEHLLFCLFVILIPFLALFLHSCYRYIIAFSSLNVVFYTLNSKKKVKDIDFKANDRVIENKLFQYIMLMLFVSILCCFPPLWIVLCISFQIFSLESNTNFIKAISRSINLTLENIISVILMLIFVSILTYWFFPTLFIWTLEKISIIDFLITHVEIYFQKLPYQSWNSILSLANMQIDSVIISRIFIETILNFIIIGFTLPLRCCCFTELYRIFDNRQIKELSKESEEIIRRASKRKRKKSL